MKTFNFDYSFALSVTEVNKVLASNMAKMDLEVSYTNTDRGTGAVTAFTGKLDPWKIVPGGGNKLVNFNIPFASGCMSVKGGPPGLDGSWDLTGVSVEAQMSFTWLGAGAPGQAVGSGSATELHLGLTNTTDSSSAGYVAAIKVFDPNNNLNPLATSLLKEFAGEMLVASRDRLQYLFATINPTPTGVSSWLRPTSWDYFYIAAGDESALAFLCMLDGDPLPSQPSFDSTALGKPGNAFLLVSQQKFFRHVVLPSMQKSYPGAKFDVSCSAEGIACVVKNTQPFTVKKVATTDLAVKVSDQGNGLQTASSGGGALKFLFGLAKLPGASYSWSLATTNPLKFANQSVTFEADTTAKPKTSQTIHWYDWILLVVTGITNLPGLISAIINLVDGFTSELNTVGVGAINTAVQDAVGRTSVNLAELVQWNNDGRTLTATDAELAGAFFVWGDLA